MQLSKINKRGNAHGITIPRAYLRDLQWGAGDYLALEIFADRLMVTRVKPPGPLVRIPPGQAQEVYAEKQA